MCGILGTFPAASMDISLLAHRGPDAQLQVNDGELISMAHARLSILDLSDRARQPKWSKNGRVLLSYNGEIYNFADLTASERQSDTVALLQWLSERGPEFDAGELDGMYAFAAWFGDQRQLVLCRDPAGIKPLYIAISDDGYHLAFASEIKAFLGVEWFSPRASRDQVSQHDTLQFGFITPRLVELSFRSRRAVVELTPTLLQGVYQLCPGQKLAISADGGIESQRIHPKTISRSQPAMEMLADSVRSQAISDVQVGVQISGGIDSSLVAWQYAKLGQPFKGFYVSVPGRDLNEDRWVNIAAEKISAVVPFDLQRVELTPLDMTRVLGDVVWHMDEPAVRHPNAIGVYLLCEHVRRRTGVKVLLTGEGADEIFGGYEWHDGKTIEDFEKSRRMFDLSGSDVVREKFASLEGSVVRRQLAFDRWFYLPPILARQDRMSMAHGIEARVPFLSNAFLNGPTPAQTGKLELKAAAAEIFGREFAYRSKCGFGLPWPWLGAMETDWDALDWLEIRSAAQTPLQSWTLASLGLWAREFLYGGWKLRCQPQSQMREVA